MKKFFFNSPSRRIYVVFWLLLFFLYLLLTFVTYHQSLSFNFWKDDWRYIWCATYPQPSCNGQWLHPATPVEFFTLQGLFGSDVRYWQYTGLFLRALVAWSMAFMVARVTKRISAGFLSGLFLSVSVVGIESVHWASAHVVAVVAVFFCLGISSWILYLRNLQKRTLFLSLLFFLLSFSADPWRAIAILPLIFFLTYFYATESHGKHIRVLLSKVSFFLFAIFIINVYYQKDFIQNTQIGLFLSSNPPILVFLQKIRIIGNYFNSLFHMATGPLIPAPHEATEFSHGILTKPFAWFGIVFVGMAGTMLFFFRNKWPGHIRVYSFFLLWVLLFYFPAWLFEPRLIAAETHRYLFLSSIGFVAVLGYSISLVRPKWLSILLVLALVILNVFSSFRTLKNISFFRSFTITESIWQRIVREATQSTRPILILQGEDPIKTNIFLYGSGFAVALKSSIRSVQDLPLVSEDADLILSVTCRKNYLVSDIPIYAWYVKKDGSLLNNSTDARERIYAQGLQRGCFVRK